MKKQLLTILLLTAGCITTIGGRISAQQPELVSGDANNLPNLPIPEPRLKDNSNLPDSKLLPIDKLKGVSKLPVGTKLIKLEKKTFGQFEKEKGESRFYDVSPSRQVYEEVTSYPELEHPRLGLVKNATVTIIFDAETGEALVEQIAAKSGDTLADPHP